MFSSTEKKKPVSSLDVAHRAGVSRTTVSFVLNNRPDVSLPQVTRDRVLQAAADLDYRPSRIGRALVTGRTNLIALWLPSLHTPYCAAVLAQLNRRRPRHYETIVRDGFSVSASGRSAPLHLPVDGVIAVDTPIYLDALHREHDGETLPVVSLGAFSVGTKDAVHVDLGIGAEEAVRHLLAEGCTRIAYLAQSGADKRQDARYLAYRRVITDAVLPEELVPASSQERATAYRTVLAHFTAPKPPDGLFCENDDMAIAALRALRDLGLRVPTDVAVVGCDGIEDGEYQEPRLSTILPPVEEMCRLAWEFLERRLTNSSLPPQQITLPTHLERRASSRRLTATPGLEEMASNDAASR